MGLEKAQVSAGEALAAAGGAIADGVTYAWLGPELAVAGRRLTSLSERVGSNFHYVQQCAQSTDRLAEQMARLEVDVDTIAEHRNAAALMRKVLEEAKGMTVEVQELATLFTQTSEAHQADYGSVAEAATSLPVPMAQAEFYGNR